MIIIILWWTVVFCYLFSQQQLIVFVKTYYKVTINNAHVIILRWNCCCGSRYPWLIAQIVKLQNDSITLSIIYKIYKNGP